MTTNASDEGIVHEQSEGFSAHLEAFGSGVFEIVADFVDSEEGGRGGGGGRS